MRKRNEHKHSKLHVDDYDMEDDLAVSHQCVYMHGFGAGREGRHVVTAGASKQTSGTPLACTGASDLVPA